tara:strand:- start:1572 stop:1730 length:159 start_codon:yes stop_codon:yes gene_type:complete
MMHRQGEFHTLHAAMDNQAWLFELNQQDLLFALFGGPPVVPVSQGGGLGRCV